jgi:hypothetical protein
MFMKYILCIATFLILGTTQSLAQSEEWMIPPELREELLRQGEYDDIPFHHNSPGTHWYEKDCCSNQDCRPYKKSEYEKVPGGYSVRYLPTVLVFVPEDLVKQRPRDALPDAFMHFCISPPIPELKIKAEPICAYLESLLF